MKIVCLSDVHEQWHRLEIPECDVLISAGDYSYLGKPTIVAGFHQWLSEQPAKHIVSVQGNHERWVEQHWDAARFMVEDIDPKIHFLRAGAFEIDGVKFYGSAATPEFMGWAFMIERGPLMRHHWSLIPDDTKVLITHGPPAGILDKNYFEDDPRSAGYGCEELLKRIDELKDLKLHIFGHIHGSSGVTVRGEEGSDKADIMFVNAAICNEDYKPVNPVRVVEI